MIPVPIDLELLGLRGAISSYLLTDPEPLLVDPGPSTTLERLKEGLASAGLRVEDLRRVLLTHVHLDHAGVTGHLMEENPELVVHVHEDGARHLIDPSRLVSSTRRTFGEDHDRLWGDVRPVPEERIEPWRPGAPDPLPGIEAHPTPGHIGHHVAYLEVETGTLLSGDCMGIILGADAPTHPPTPPPSLDLRAWEETLERLTHVGAERAAVAHFGVHGDFDGRRRQLRERLAELESRVRRALEEGREGDAERYERDVIEGLGRYVPEGRAEEYFRVFSPSIDWQGVRFYLERNPDA